MNSKKLILAIAALASAYLSSCGPNSNEQFFSSLRPKGIITRNIEGNIEEQVTFTGNDGKIYHSVDSSADGLRQHDLDKKIDAFYSGQGSSRIPVNLTDSEKELAFRAHWASMIGMGKYALPKRQKTTQRVYPTYRVENSWFGESIDIEKK